MTVAYRFGRFEVRPATRQLLVDEQPAALGARAFDLLLGLIERRERLVGKDELFALVWPGLVVEENNLQVQVSALRKVLGPEAIATVAGHGYRFTLAPTEVTTPEPSQAAAAKHNLPAQVASFIGRARELADLQAMLSRHRCVTLTGVGGIGKTRLALELAATAAEPYADGVWFVDLAPVLEGALVPNAVAATLGVREPSGQPVREALLEFVRERALLVVLDNCEHLLPACAQLTRDLLQAGPKLTIVATSREPLHVAGEASFPLPTLATPDPRNFSLDALRAYAAVELFVDRAIAVRRDFALTQQNAAAVARICHHLDGIPLAIELAAARVRAMSAEVIAANLTDRFRLLKSGDVTGLPRQQTLRATIDWSYDLLTPSERSLLQRLSVFAGGFALDGAEAVGAGGEVAQTEVLELVANLVDKSLVGFDVQGERYRMLETVRQYAQERLTASGEETATRDRHLSFYVGFGERLNRVVRGPQQGEYVVLVHTERDNIAVAFAHARETEGGGQAGLAMIHSLITALTQTHLDLALRLAREALAHPDAQAEDIARGRALYTLAWLDFWAGRYEPARIMAEESVRIVRRCNDRRALAEALYRLGCICVSLGRTEEAEPHFNEEISLGRELGVPVLVAEAHSGLGELYSLQGRLELAQHHYQEAMAFGSQEPDSIVNGNLNLARNAIMLRDEAAALGNLRAALAAWGTIPSLGYSQGLLYGSAGVALLRGESTRALRYFGAAAGICQRTGYRPPEPDSSFIERNLLAAREAAGPAAADEAFAQGRMDESAAIEDARAWVQSLPASPDVDESARSAVPARERR